MKLTRRLAGLAAKRNGQSFEDIFHAACLRNGMAISRIPDGCRQIGARRLMRVKSPFDFVITHHKRSALIDTKTCNAATFPNSAITEHQALELISHETRGAAAGYIVWLRKIERILFIPASVLTEASFRRGSISPETAGVIDIGSIQDMDPRKILAPHIPSEESQ